MNNVCPFSTKDSRISRNTGTCGHGRKHAGNMRMFLPSAIPARNIPEPEATDAQNIPTCPDSASPWPEDSSLGGWSARMFLHQLFRGSLPRWKPSDTERLLSGWMPLRIRDKAGNGISLSDYIKKPGEASEVCFRSSRMVRGLIRRGLKRGRSFRLLLRTGRDTIPVIVTFGTKKRNCSESWTLRSGKPLPDSLADGLMDYLRRHAPESMETARSRDASKK